WKQEFLSLHKKKWPELVSFRGKLNDPKMVVQFFESYLQAQRMLEKLHTYAHLRMDEDLGNDVHKGDFGLISSLIHEFSLTTAWMEPELLSLPQEQFQKLLADEQLKPYRFHLEKIGK